jgi:uncharacterized membrane protein YdjX (TVP38/TMEM64 family)
LASDTPTQPAGWRRFAPVGVLLLALTAAVAFRIDRFISLDALQHQREALDAYVAQHYLAALAIYAALFVLGVTISLPTLLVLSVAGGYLFGVWTGAAAAWASANIGAILIFLALRSAIGGGLRRAAAPWLERFDSRINDNAFFYLLMLRLIPPLPFWVVNLAASCFDVKLRDYALATVIGVIPIILAFTMVGAALREALDAGAALDPAAAAQHVLGSPQFIAATLALIAFALLPTLYNRVRGRAPFSNQG